MRLRSGRITNKCGICKEYFGNPKWNNKCSTCSGISRFKSSVCFDDPIFQENLQEWIDSKLIEKAMENILIHTCRNSVSDINFSLLRKVLLVIKMNDRYISAEFAEKLCRSIGVDTYNKSQLILQLVADWWNMKKYKFTGTEMCYFGRFGDIHTFREEIKSIPPPPPNKPPISAFII